MEILEALWYGKICPAGKAKYREAYFQELAELLRRNEAKLTPTLNARQQEDLQKMKDLWEEMNGIGECAAFMEGFRLAVQLMTASVG